MTNDDQGDDSTGAQAVKLAGLVSGPDKIVLQPCATYGWDHPDRVKYPVFPAEEYTRTAAIPDADAIAALVGALQEIQSGWTSAADPDTGELVEVAMSEDEMISISRTALARLEGAKPMRCAECDCQNGGTDCNWIKSEGKV
jgi:hypothetical protein